MTNDENTQLILLLKYMITLKNINTLKLRMSDLDIELKNLQDELNEMRSILTTHIINKQSISLDESYNIKIKSTSF